MRLPFANSKAALNGMPAESGEQDVPLTRALPLERELRTPQGHGRHSFVVPAFLDRGHYRSRTAQGSRGTQERPNKETKEVSVENSKRIVPALPKMIQEPPQGRVEAALKVKEKRLTYL